MSDQALHMPELASLMRTGTLQLQALPPLSLYIHLPWCLKKCPYCDFNSHVLGKNTLELPASQEKAYIQALLADLDASLPLVWGRSIVSIFIGGGTPSLFSPTAIAQLLSDIRARLPVIANAEITLEANPGTFEKDRFAAFAQEAGVNRLSIGVQSFDDALLQKIGRIHSAQQADQAIDEARKYFSTFNIDLMYGLPGQSLQMAQHDIQQALSLQAPHLSAYHMTLEPQTFFGAHPPKHLPDQDQAYDMLDAIKAQINAAQLDRYEVSAYAKNKHLCQHNLNYWTFGDYLGIGAGAHSKLSFAHRIIRQARLKDPLLYMRQAHKKLMLSSSQEVSRRDLPFEFMMNALRLRHGFLTSLLTERTGLLLSCIEKPLAQAHQLGLIQLDHERITPTEKGFDFLSDLQALFLPEPLSKDPAKACH